MTTFDQLPQQPYLNLQTSRNNTYINIASCMADGALLGEVVVMASLMNFNRRDVAYAAAIGADGARSAVRRGLGIGSVATYVTLQDFVELDGEHLFAELALLRLLEPLARRGLNLSRIQSRPTRRKLWEYAFFLDVEGHAEEPAMAEALVELQGACASLKVLGSYPRAVEVAR